MALPQILTDINIFVEGVGHLGTSTKATLPKIETSKETQTFGGFERSVDSGIFKEMSAEITLGEYSTSVYEAIANNIANPYGATIVIKGSLLQGGERKQVVATLTGKVDVDDGDMEANKTVERKLTIAPTIYALEIDGKQQCLFDTNNMIAEINGKDYLADLRSHIQ